VGGRKNATSSKVQSPEIGEISFKGGRRKSNRKKTKREGPKEEKEEKKR